MVTRETLIIRRDGTDVRRTVPLTPALERALWCADHIARTAERQRAARADLARRRHHG